MRESPRRLRREGAQFHLPAGASGPREANDGPRLLRRLRVVRRFVAVVVWTLASVPVQAWS